MYKPIAFLVAVLTFMPLAALADPPAASDAPPPAAGATAAPLADQDKLYCVENPQPTGSHLSGGKECHTRADWEKLHGRMGALMQQMFRSMDQNAQTGTPSGGH